MTSPSIDLVLIEDNPQDVELTRRALQKSHITNSLIVLGDGEEALDYLFGTGRHADRLPGDQGMLVLLDLKLPKVDGLTVLRRIKADDRTRSIPVVVLTASEQEKDLINTYTFGVSSYLVKPINFTKLAQAMRHLGLYWQIHASPPDA